MYTDNKPYTIIDNTKLETIKKYCTDNNLNFDLTTTTGQWGAFAHYYGNNKRYGNYKLISFTNMVAMIITHTKLEDKSEEYIKEDSIGIKLFDELEKIGTEKTDDNTKTRKIFQKIVELYDDPNFDSTYAIPKISKAIRFSHDQVEKISKYPGNDFSKKVKYIIGIIPEYDDLMKLQEVNKE